MTHAHRFSRRNALFTAGALAIGPSTTSGSSRALVAVVIITGIDGGGALYTETGQADFAIFATQVTTGNDDQPLVIGQIQWTATSADRSDVSLKSVRVDEYGWIDGIDGGRWVRGSMAVNGAGEYPFVLRAVDGGSPGAGKDTVELVVGTEIEGATHGEFGYRAEGSLTSGDLQILELTVESPEGAGTVTPTPTEGAG